MIADPILDKLQALAEWYGVGIIVCDGWPACGGTYTTDGDFSLIHIDTATHDLVDQRWILAHEIGHHVSRLEVMKQHESMEEVANKFAAALLAELVSQNIPERRPRKRSEVEDGPPLPADPILDKLQAICENHDIDILVCNGWPAAGGMFATDGTHSLVHIDSTRDIVDLRWILAHEIGHAFTRSHVMEQTELMEPLANSFGTALLAKLVSDTLRGVPGEP